MGENGINDKQLMHDIRLQVHIIMGCLRIIEGNADGGMVMAGKEDVTGLIRGIGEAGERMTAMLREQLDGSMVDKSIARAYSLDGFIRGIANGTEALLIDGGFTLEYECVGDPHTRCDSAKLERIIYNLLTNAVNHTPKGSILRVCVVKAESGCEISVEDKGGGLTPLQGSVLTGHTPYTPETERMYGLRSVRRLADEIKAKITWEKIKPVGMKIRVFLPEE